MKEITYNHTFYKVSALKNGGRQVSCFISIGRTKPPTFSFLLSLSAFYFNCFLKCIHPSVHPLLPVIHLALFKWHMSSSSACFSCLWLLILHSIFVSVDKVFEIEYWSPLNCEWESEKLPLLLTSGLSLVSHTSPNLKGNLLLGFFLAFEVWMNHYGMSFSHEVHWFLSARFFPGSTSHFLGFNTVLQVLPLPSQFSCTEPEQSPFTQVAYEKEAREA